MLVLLGTLSWVSRILALRSQPSPCRPLPLPSQLPLVLTAPNPSAALSLPLPVPVAGSQQATFSLGSSQGLVLPLHSQAGSSYPSPPCFIPSLAGMGHSSALTVDCLLCARVLLSCCLSCTAPETKSASSLQQPLGLRSRRSEPSLMERD